MNMTQELMEYIKEIEPNSKIVLIIEGESLDICVSNIDDYKELDVIMNKGFNKISNTLV